jgi:hypothetical protein
MKEIPVPFLRANQIGMVSLIILAILTQLPIIIFAVWLIEVIGLILGLKANLFVQLAKPFMKQWIARSGTEARELSRFNNTLAVIFLSLSVLFFGLGWTTAGYIVAGTLATVATVAICGFCLGCFLYFQYKMFVNRKARRNAEST